MFAQTHAFEQFDGIGVQDLPCAFARIDGEQDCNQSAHDMGIAIAGKSQHWAARAVRAHSGVEPDLARATLNLVEVAMRRLRQWRQFAPQLNQIAIAVVPVVQDRKIAQDLLNVSHCVQARTPVAYVGFYIESNAAQVDISTGAVRLGRSPQACGVTPRVVHPSAAPGPATGSQGRRGSAYSASPCPPARGQICRPDQHCRRRPPSAWGFRSRTRKASSRRLALWSRADLRRANRPCKRPVDARRIDASRLRLQTRPRSLPRPRPDCLGVAVRSRSATGPARARAKTPYAIERT